MTLLQKKILKNTKKTLETSTEFSCDFCKKSFQREEAMLKHICEPKRRWQDKDLTGNRLGFQVWQQFYVKNTATKKVRTYEDFAKSAYYIAFVKFGNYCVNVKALNVMRFADWLMSNKVKVDSWCSDVNYDKFLKEYLKDEDPMDAIARSIETTIELAQTAEIQTKDCLRYANKNRLVQMVVNGKISPWMLYHSTSGIEFLESLDETQHRMIMDYIHPEQWAVKFKRNQDSVSQVRELLKDAGY